MKRKQSNSTEEILTPKDLSQEIVREYLAFVLEHGKQPATIYQFAQKLKLQEDEFYQHFNSFNAVEKQLWRNFIELTMKKVEAEEIYNQYTVREKLLAFYYTLIEVLKANRSFVLYSLKPYKRTNTNPEVLKALKQQFMYYINELLLEGKETEEILNRPFISDRYEDGIWLQFLFVINFWIQDDSLQFEKTDAAIEKAVHLSFDLMGKGPLDTIVDFAKFVFNNR